MDKYLEDSIQEEIQNTVIVDFDGTIIQESKELLINFQDEIPLPGVIKGLREVKNKGYRIKIWSCRTSDLYPIEFRLMQRKMMEEYLKKYKISYDAILMVNKPFACAYVDSRSIKPDWDRILDQIENIKKKINKNVY